MSVKPNGWARRKSRLRQMAINPAIRIVGLIARHRDVPPLAQVNASLRNTSHFAQWRPYFAGGNQTGQDDLFDCRVNSCPAQDTKDRCSYDFGL